MGISAAVKQDTLASKAANGLGLTQNKDIWNTLQNFPSLKKMLAFCLGI